MPVHKQYIIHGVSLNQREICLPKSSIQDKQKARDLRKNRVFSEVVFWRLVRAGTFHGIDFHRQICVGPYIVDFYIRCFGVAIELDGASHRGKYEYDKRRDAYLQSLGIYIIHIQANLVLKNPDSVLRYIEAELVENFRSDN